LHFISTLLSAFWTAPVFSIGSAALLQISLSPSPDAMDHKGAAAGQLAALGQKATLPHNGECGMLECRIEQCD